MDPASLVALNPNEGFHHNLLVFGVAGSGVSSFVNTVATGIQPQRVSNVVKNLSKASAPNTPLTPGKRTTTTLTKHILTNYLPNLKVCLWESWGVAVSGGGGNNYESIELDLMMQGMLSDRLTMPKDTKVLNQIISTAKKADHMNAIHAALFVVPQELLTDMAGQEIITVRKLLKKLRDLGRPVFVVLTKIDRYTNDDGLTDKTVTDELCRLASRLLEVDEDKVHAVTNYNSPKYSQSAKRVETVDKTTVELMTRVLQEACAFQDRDPASIAMRRSRNNLANLSSSQNELRKPSSNDTQRQQSSAQEKVVPLKSELETPIVPSPRKNNGLAFDTLFAQVPEEMRPPNPNESDEIKDDVKVEEQDDHKINVTQDENMTENESSRDIYQEEDETSKTNSSQDSVSSEPIARKFSQTSVDKSLPTFTPLQTTAEERVQQTKKKNLSPTTTNEIAKLSTDITESNFARTDVFSTAYLRSSPKEDHAVEQDIASAAFVTQQSQRQSHESVEKNTGSPTETEKPSISHVERMESFKNELLNATKLAEKPSNIETNVLDKKAAAVPDSPLKHEVKKEVAKNEVLESNFKKEKPLEIAAHVVETKRKDSVASVASLAEKEGKTASQNIPATLPASVQQVEKNTKQKGLLSSFNNVFSPKEKVEKHEKTTSPTTVQSRSATTLTSPVQDGVMGRLVQIESTQMKMEESLEEFKANAENSIREVSNSADINRVHLEELKAEVTVLNATTETIHKSQNQIQELIQQAESSIKELRNKTDDLEAKLCLIQHDMIPASVAADKDLLEVKAQELNVKIEKITKQQREAEKMFDEHIATNTVRFKEIEELQAESKNLVKFQTYMEDLSKSLRKEVETLKTQQAQIQNAAACRCVIS